MIEELKKTFGVFNQKFSRTNIQEKTRLDNFKNFIQLGFPTKKSEDWKFSDFNKIILNNFKNLNINLDEQIKFNFNNYIKEFEHNKIVLLNGFYNKHSFEYENKKKIIFNDIQKSIHSELGSIRVDEVSNSLNLLNNAFYIDGVSLIVKKGYQFNKPLIIYNVFNTKKDNNFFNQKLNINVKENSKLDLIICTINLNTVPIFLNNINHYTVEKNSLLKLFCLNEFHNKDLNYSFSNIKVMNNAIFENFILSYSSNFFKNDIKCILKENHSSGFINGAILNKDNQHHEIKTRIEHIGRNTKSYQKIKSVLDKNSKAIFQGKIYVDSKAQKTDGYQLSKAILLDKNSEFDSKPELEIYADDVKCSHGSTSGSLDENAIFYLMSRGLSRFEAKKLLIKGFLIDAIETITNKQIKQYFLNKLEIKINELK